MGIRERPGSAGWSVLLLLSSLAGCSSGPAADEPSPAEVRRQLAEALARGQVPLRLSELQAEGEGRYAGEAKDSHGAAYRVTLTTHGRSLRYEAEGVGGVFRGATSWPEPPFYERYPAARQALLVVAFLVNGGGVAYTALVVFGLRRRYSRRTETILSVVGAVSLGLAAYWAYLFVSNFGAAGG